MSDFSNDPKLNCDYLFQKKPDIKETYEKVVYCRECKYAEKKENLKPGYIHCKYYPNMISHEDAYCKAGTKK